MRLKFVSSKKQHSCIGLTKQLIMTCSIFDQLSEARQTDVIWEDGTFLDRRSEGFYNVLLFQIDDFYTEVYYHAHFNVIIKIESFSDTDRLEPYLDHIKLPELFSNL
jgi:hypothetical protein